MDKIGARQEKAEKKLADFLDGYYSTDAKKPNQVYKDENGDYKMPWMAAPTYMKEFMPSREDPKQVYLNFTKVLTHSTKEVNAEGISNLIRRFADALDPVVYVDFRKYAFDIALEIEKRKSDPNYSRLEGLKDASRMMRLDHQAEFHTKLMKMKDVEEFKVPFCRTVSKAIDKIKGIYLPNKTLAPFGALSVNQRQEVAHIHTKKIPESRYKPTQRNQHQGQRGQRGGRRDFRKPYDRDYRDRNYRDRDYRDRTHFRDNRDRNQQYQQHADDSAPRGRGGRRGSRGGRGRGRGRGQSMSNVTPQEGASTTGKVQLEKPTKESVWKHSETDKDAVIDAFSLHDF